MCKAAFLLAALISAIAIIAALPIPGHAQSLIEQPLLPVEDGNQWIYVKEGTGDLARVTVTAHWMGGHPALHTVRNYMFPADTGDMVLMNDSCARTLEVSLVMARPAVPDAPVRTPPIRVVKGILYYCDNGCFTGLDYVLPVIGTDCFNEAKARVIDTGAPVTVPAGTFQPSVTIHYQGGACPEGRVVQETLVPGIGLTRRIVAHIGAARGSEILDVWSLCSARVSGRFIGQGCGPDPTGGPALAPVEQTTWGALKSIFR